MIMSHKVPFFDKLYYLLSPLVEELKQTENKSNQISNVRTSINKNIF